MPYNQKIHSKKLMICRQNLPKVKMELPGRDFQNMLHLLNCSDNLDVLVKIFTTLGLFTLSKKNTTHERIIKCEALYRKLVLVLKSGLQTKIIIALNLISAILFLDDESDITKNKTLHYYAKNMIRISGCLTTMTDLFTSFMMHQDTWKALCRSTRDACDACATNQSHCSHLVPLCIQRCQRGSLEPILLLQSLLSNHQRNIQLFHDSNGMTIFTRESLQNPVCLLLLNTVVENTKSENQSEILKASHLFRELQYHMHKYGPKSSIGKWVSIVLYSHRKVFGRDKDEEQENENIFNNATRTLNPHSTYNTGNDNNCNETSELFRNVLNEVADWQNQCGNQSFKSIYENRNYNDTFRRLRNNKQPAYGGWHSTENKLFKDTTEYETSNHFSSPFTYNSNDDQSFSFLLKQNKKELRIRDAKNAIGSAVRPEIQCNNNSDTGIEKTFRYVFKTSTKDKHRESIEEFKPLYVSTPKSRNLHSKEKIIFRTKRKSLRSSTRDHVIGDKNFNGGTKFINTPQTYKKLRNTSLSAKLFNIVNESCTTLIKGFKNIFKSKKAINLSKESVVTTYQKQDNSCNYTLTNRIKQKDARRDSQVVNDEERANFTKGFSKELSNFGSCNTCDDTILIKDKLAKDVTLQRTIKKLKLGINLYGCDFKKISRTMWPNKAYMTPNVIYNLYRKLILKQ